MGNGETPELGPVTGGRRVVELIDMEGVKLGTENEVTLRVGAIVGRVPDKVKVLLKAVLSGIVRDVLVVGTGTGTTETVVETVAMEGLPPALVRIWVLVPLVT